MMNDFTGCGNITCSALPDLSAPEGINSGRLFFQKTAFQVDINRFGE
jgi:hypothetical protein